MSDIDTMRWGDTQTLVMTEQQTVETDSGPSQVGLSSQMLNLKWQRPLTWRLMVSAVPTVSPGDNGVVSITVFVTMFVGVGQANQEVPLFTWDFSAGPPPDYVGSTQFFDVPAEALQLRFTTVCNPPAADDGTYVTVTAMGAPITEPRVTADVRELLRKLHDMALPSRSGDPTDGDGQPRWMPPGFDDGVMRYRP